MNPRTPNLLEQDAERLARENAHMPYRVLYGLAAQQRHYKRGAYFATEEEAVGFAKGYCAEAEDQHVRVAHVEKRVAWQPVWSTRSE